MCEKPYKVLSTCGREGIHVRKTVQSTPDLRSRGHTCAKNRTTRSRLAIVAEDLYGASVTTQVYEQTRNPNYNKYPVIRETRLPAKRGRLVFHGGQLAVSLLLTV
ncbi:hypothetical protein SAMN04488602_11039 [Paenibacillus sp. cl123]|nr:hypothetical protein SAMN04488602_11039 [Paenibacillus sp. cl123]